VDLFNDTIVAHFQKIMQQRHKQVSINRFLVKNPKVATEVGNEQMDIEIVTQLPDVCD
jgi:hypothetical protein